MRAFMGVIRNRHGVYEARKKVPKRLEEATARVLDVPKRRQSWLKKSLGTKDLREAKVRAKPVLMEFDSILERAQELLKAQPTRTSLTRIEIARMAEFHYASMLGNDEIVRRDARQIAAEFHDASSPADTSAYGLTNDEFDRRGQAFEEELKAAQAALARGNIEYVVGEVEELLDTFFRIRLDRTSPSYRTLGLAVLAEHVKALQALQRRQAGEPIDTPRQPEVDAAVVAPNGDTLRTAFEGLEEGEGTATGQSLHSSGVRSDQWKQPRVITARSLYILHIV
jgi:hypothetical protein